jgi:hypothetical protein
MFENDYIMRMIREFAIMLAALVGLKREGKYEEAADLIEGALRRLFQIDLQLVRALSYEDLLGMLNLNAGVEIEKCTVLAKVLQEQGDLEAARGAGDEGCDSSLKALQITLAVFSSSKRGQGDEQRLLLNSLLTHLHDNPLPVEARFQLFGFYETTGQFARAEDCLYDLLDQGYRREELISEGLGFYERLLKKDRGDLARGNLPLDEVREGLAQLRSLLK